MSRAAVTPKQYRRIWMLCCVVFLYMRLLPGVSCDLTFGRCGQPPNTGLTQDDEKIYVCPSSLHTQVCGDSPTTLCCEVDGKETADNITISIGGLTLQSEKIGDTTRKVNIYLKEVGHYIYKCRTKSKQMKIKSVYVIKPPSNVIDFKCRSDNLETLNCTWSRPNNDYITKYKITDFINGSPRIDAKVIDKDLRTVYAVWSESTRPQYQKSVEKLTFNLTSSNHFGAINEMITIAHHSIVKPKPVSKLAALNITSRTAILEWQLDVNMMLLEGVKVKFKIEVQSLVNNQSSIEYDSYTIQKKQKKNTFKLNSLIAYTNYSASVFVKPWNASSEFWSEPSQIKFLTKSEKPARPPIIPAGAFISRGNNNRRIVDVYWKQLEEYEEAGAGFGYIVNVIESSNNSKYLNKSGSFELETNYLNAIEILVSSNNEVGSSNTSSLYVPAVTDSKLNVNSFTVLSYKNGTYDMMWLNEDNIDNYTVFWCKQVDQKFCTNGIEFEKVDWKKQEHRVNLTQEYIYQFGIAANKGQMSSGITINKECDHFSEDSLATSNFPVTIDVANYTDSRVDLKWSLKCLYKKGIITGYNITYSYINPKGECFYNKSETSSEYIRDPARNEISITGLHPFTEYKFQVDVVTKSRSKAGTASTNYVTKQGTPQKPEIINITEVTNNSVTINLKPPFPLNGPLKNIRFIVYNNDSTEVYNKISKCSCTKCENVIVENLPYYTDHRLSVVTYNTEINSYSAATSTTFKTKMGRPDNITPWYSSTNSTLMWHRPQLRGVLYHYEVKIKPICDSCIYNIFETNDTYFTDIVTGCISRTYYVRAVNVNESGDLFYGDWGSGHDVDCHNNLKLILYIAFGTILLLASLYMSYKGSLTLKVRMRVDPPKFHPSLFSNYNLNDGDLRSTSKIENYGLIGEDISKAKMQQNYSKSNKLNYLEVIPFLMKKKTKDFDLILSGNLTESHIKCEPNTTQPIINSEKDNGSQNDPVNKHNNNSQNVLPYRNYILMNLPTGYVQAYPTHNITDKSEDSNVPSTFPGWKHSLSLENLPKINKETRKQLSISNMHSGYVRALPDVLTSVADHKLGHLLTNDQSVKSKYSQDYVKDWEAHVQNRDVVSNNDDDGKVLPMITSTHNPKSNNLSTFRLSGLPGSKGTSSGYVKASPEHLNSLSSKSNPILESISTNDETKELSRSEITSGYVKALPMLTQNIDFESTPTTTSNVNAEDIVIHDNEL